MKMDHVQDVFGFLFEGADFLVQLGDPDSIERGHGHGCNRYADCDESFWPAWH